METKWNIPAQMRMKMLSILCAVIITASLLFSMTHVYGAPGDLIWTRVRNPSMFNDFARAVDVDSTGVYIVGDDVLPGGSGSKWRVEKRSVTDGSILWKKTSNPSSSWDRAFSVAVDGTGVYTVGHDRKLGNDRWRIEKRSLTDGSLIWRKTSNPSSGYDVATGVALDSTSVYVVGTDQSSGDYRWRIEKRSLTDGSLIWVKTSNPSSDYDIANGVAVDSSGVYIVGYDSVFGQIDKRWRIEKRSITDGSIIWRKTPNFSIGWDEAYDVAADGTGVYIVGFDCKPWNDRWRIEKRSLTDGSLTWKRTRNPSSHSDRARGVAIDGTGLYITGYDEKLGDSNRRWRIEKRSLTDGSITWVKTKNPSSGEDEAYDVSVDGSGVYIVGYDSKRVDPRWRMEKRHL